MEGTAFPGGIPQSVHTEVPRGSTMVVQPDTAWLPGSPMRYRLAILTLDNWPFVEISSGEFEEIKDAKTKLTIALELEEKFELLVDNYAEFERTLLDLTLTNMIRQEWVWTSFMNQRQLVNRRIANFLMSARLYTDQAKQDIATMYGAESQAADDLNKAFDRESDESLGYRVMKEIRNHTQHRALPVGELSYPGTHQQDGKSGVRFGIQLQLDVDELRNDPRFNRRLLAEVEQNDAARDLTHMTRQYMESLSRVHESVRGLTEAGVAVWTAKIDDVVETARTKIGHTLGLAAVRQEDEGLTEKVYVFSDLAKRARGMRVRYPNLKFSARWYVSSAIS